MRCPDLDADLDTWGQSDAAALRVGLKVLGRFASDFGAVSDLTQQVEECDVSSQGQDRLVDCDNLSHLILLVAECLQRLLMTTEVPL
jgi:hypothetical protein